MIKTLLLLLLLCLLFFSCQLSDKPKGVMSEAELAQFLTEVYLAEAKLDNLPLPHDSSQKLFIPFEEAFLKKKALNDTLLKITYRYYMEHPKELEKVYDIVIDTLSLHEQKAAKSPPPAPVK